MEICLVSWDTNLSSNLSKIKWPQQPPPTPFQPTYHSRTIILSEHMNLVRLTIKRNMYQHTIAISTYYIANNTTSVSCVRMQGDVTSIKHYAPHHNSYAKQVERHALYHNTHNTRHLYTMLTSFCTKSS